MPTVRVRRTYLELPSVEAVQPARVADPAARFERLRPIAVDDYRALYRAVGEQWHWRDRLEWSDERLAEQLARADVEVWVLTVDGARAGYVEFERHDDGSVEIVYFGLVPSFIGRGLGGQLLTSAIDTAWKLGAQRVWLHTCTLDAPQALPNYEARGFRAFKVEWYDAQLP